MRVIAGTARGRPLRVPRGDTVRPTANRVREAIFDVLSSLSVLKGASVLDLFAGTGALGIEAASRGAESVTFVEKDRRTAALIEANLVATGLSKADNTQVVVADALSFCELSSRRFDLALIDPPYAFSDWKRLLGRLSADTIVCESDAEVELGQRYRLYRIYRYGTTLVTVARSESDPGQGTSS